MSLTKASNQIIQQPYSRNTIINGDFNMWQRSTSIATAPEAAMAADKFELGKSNDGVVTISRSTDTPSSVGFNYSHDLLVTTADTSLASGQYTSILYRIEGYDCLRFIGNTITLSFWVKSKVAGTYHVSLRKGLQQTDIRTCAKAYTINNADTWEYKAITFPIFVPSTIGGTWNFTAGQGLNIWWSLGQGSTYTGALDAWSSSNVLGGAGQVNIMNSINNYFRITGIQMEIGNTATPFEYKHISDTVRLCQRYYETGYGHWLSNYTGPGVYFDIVQFCTSKRISPTIVFVSPATGASARIRNASAGSDVTVTGIPPTTLNGYTGPIPTSESMLDMNSYSWLWYASAELIWSD
jgi:hypothetical protein